LLFLSRTNWMNSKNRPKAPKNLWGIPDKVGLSSYFDSHEQRKGIAYLYQLSAVSGSLKTSTLQFQTCSARQPSTVYRYCYAIDPLNAKDGFATTSILTSEMAWVEDNILGPVMVIPHRPDRRHRLSERRRPCASPCVRRPRSSPPSWM